MTSRHACHLKKPPAHMHTWATYITPPEMNPGRMFPHVAFNLWSAHPPQSFLVPHHCTTAGCEMLKKSRGWIHATDPIAVSRGRAIHLLKFHDNGL